MTYDEVVAAVYELTKRPDLAAETALAIRAATLKAHGSDYYFRDMQEQIMTFIAYQYEQIVEITQALGRFRNLKYLRKYDPSGVNPNTGLATGAAGELFEILDPEDVFDTYHLQKDNVAYIAGNYLNMASRTGTFAYVITGWYVYPGIGNTNDTYLSWIAREIPFAIVYDAAATIFKTIGRDTENRTYREMVMEQYAILRMTGVTAHAG